MVVLFKYTVKYMSEFKSKCESSRKVVSYSFFCIGNKTRRPTLTTGEIFYEKYVCKRSLKTH